MLTRGQQKTPLTTTTCVRGAKLRDTTLFQPTVARRPSAASNKARTDNGVSRTALIGRNGTVQAVNSGNRYTLWISYCLAANGSSLN